MSSVPIAWKRNLPRSAGQDAAGPNWQVTYNLDLTLKSSAPPGLFVDRLILRTNDPNQQAAQVPLTVEALVLEPLSASPSPLVLGTLRPKQSVSKVILVKGEKPFRILEVTGPDDRFQATLPTQTADLHRVLLRFTAGGTPGRVTGKVRIKTDLPVVRPVEVRRRPDVRGRCGGRFRRRLDGQRSVRKGRNSDQEVLARLARKAGAPSVSPNPQYAQTLRAMILTHNEMTTKMLKRPAVKAEYEEQAEEFALLDELLRARKLGWIPPRRKLRPGWDRRLCRGSTGKQWRG